MINLPEKCLRGKKTCEPLAQIESDCGTSFICCGENDGTERKVEQDKYTICWKSEEIDTEDHVDKFDIMDTISVLAQGLSVAQHKEREANDSE